MPAGWSDEANSAFERIYGLDLVYRQDCYRLCGDAHCCSFARYKQKFVFLANTPYQELFLLPGEWEYLTQKGTTAQFGDHEHKSYAFPVGSRYVRAETLLSRRPHCACDHDTRTTVCRLYPILPVFDLEGRFVGTESFGTFEDMEALEQLPRACRIDSLPTSQLDLLLALTGAIGRVPLFVFYATAYRRAKAHLKARLAERKRERPDKSTFSHFEDAFFRRQLFDLDALSAELEQLRKRFSQHYGATFDSAFESVVTEPPAPAVRRPQPRAGRTRLTQSTSK